MNIKNKVRSSYPSNAKWINHAIAENAIVDLRHYTCVEGGRPDTMLAERILQDYATTCLPSVSKLSSGKQYTHNLAQKDLEYLNLKLDAVRKTITSWDVYNIKGVAESEEEVDQMISIATPNTAFISNVRVGKQNIAPGDIVFTDLNNVVHIIQHAAAGYFYPAQWKNISGNTYKLTYSWSTTDPIKDQESVLESEKVLSKATDKISATIKTGNELGFAQTYIIQSGEQWTKIEGYPTSHSIDANNSKRIPLITIFTINGEKIWLDNMLKYIDQANINETYTTAGWYITNPTSMTIYVEVR